MSVDPATAAAWEAEKPRVDDESPWPGLEAFREGDQRFFHGREAETDLLLALIRRARLTVLCGVPGFGKTSLLRAAAFPRLREENHLPVYLRLDYRPDAPSLRAQVLRALAQAVAKHGVEAPEVDEALTLWEYFHRRGTEFWSARNQPVVPVLVLDQFEEAFTLGRADERRAAAVRAFLEELGDLIEGRVPQALRQAIDGDPARAADYAFTQHGYRIVLSLREDYLAELESLRDRIPAVAENRLRLERMRGPDAVKAVVRAGGRLIPEGMGERIVRFTAGGSEAPLADLAVEPWLLSLVCSELNKRRRERGESEISQDLLTASQTEILSDFYEDCVEDLDGSVRRFVEEDLLTETGSRDSEAIDNALERERVRPDDLQRLIDRRLLRVEDRGGRPRVELTHDVLAPVVRRSRDVRRELERRAADEAEARELREEEAKRREEEAKRQYERMRSTVRRNRAIAGVAALIVVLVVIGLWRVARERDRAQSALAVTALHQSHAARDDGQRDLALARAAYALRTAPGSATASAALFSMLVYDHVHGEVFTPLGDGLAHAGAVRWAILSRDGERAVTASDDGTAQVWEVESGARLGPPLRHRGPVVYAAFHRDGRRVVTASEDGTAQVWRVGSSTRIGPRLRHDGPVRTALFNQDRVLTASADGTVRVWEVPDEKAIAVLRHGGDVLRASATADGSRILSLSGDGTARVWELDSRGGRNPYGIGAVLQHSGPVRAGQLSRDGRRIVTASDDGTAQVWELENDLWQRLGAPLRHDGPVTWAAFRQDGQRVVTASADRTARIWELVGDAGDRRWQGVGEPLVHDGPVASAFFSTDRRWRWVVTASGDGTSRLWDAGTGRPLGAPLRHEGPVAFALFGQDGRRIVTSSADGTARVWASGPLGEPLALVASEIDAAAIAGDGATVASYDRDRRVVGLWHIGDDVRPGETLRNATQALGAMITSDGRRAVTAEGDAAYVREAGRIEPVAELPHQDLVLAAAFDAAGRQIATGTADKRARLWRASDADASRWEAVGEPLPHGGSVYAVVFSDDGEYLATAARDDKVRVWSTRTQSEVGKARYQPGVRLAAFSPRGDRVATAAWDGSARLWEVESGDAVRAQLRHESAVTSMSFSPDGRWLATGSTDRTARVWDAETGAPVSVPFTHRERVLAVRFSRDSRWLVTVSADGWVRRWEIGVGGPDDARHLAALAESLASARVNDEGGDDSLGAGATPPDPGASELARSLRVWMEEAPLLRRVSPSSQARLQSALAPGAAP